MSVKHVVGIDPGFASCGVAVAELGRSDETPVLLHVIRTSPPKRKTKVLVADHNLFRAQLIAEELIKLLLQYNVVAVGAESMSYPRSASASAKLGISWGIVAALSVHMQLPVFQVSPQALKARLTGSGMASKVAVANAVRRRYPEADFEKLLKALPSGQHEHAWDALASMVVCLDAEPVKMVRRLL